jgi:PAS domain-containing protein
LNEIPTEVETVRQSDEIFRLLVESVQDYAIFLLSPKGRILTWNTGAQRIKGYATHEIIGQHFSRFYSREAVESGWPDRIASTKVLGSARTISLCKLAKLLKQGRNGRLNCKFPLAQSQYYDAEGQRA